MDLFASLGGSNRFTAHDLCHQVKPAACLGRMGQAINACRPQRADRPTLPQTVTVYELFQRRLVCPVEARRPQGMGFVEWPIVENHLVDRAGRDEHEARDAGLESSLEELERAGQVDA